MTDTIRLTTDLRGRRLPTATPTSAGPFSRDRPLKTGLERRHHHLIIVPTAATATHEIDFEFHEVGPGQLVHVQPGQLHRCHRDAATGWSIAVPPATCPQGLFVRSELSPLVELGDAAPIIEALACDIAREQRAGRPNPEVMIDGATLLLRHVARAAESDRPQSHHHDLLRSFRAEIERSFAVSRSVSAFARTIGTSTKTLSRATLGLVGQSPKELIDQRVTLEAKRMLAATDDPIAGIGLALGFTEATNFTKFFARTAGQTPQGFRTDWSVPR